MEHTWIFANIAICHFTLQNCPFLLTPPLNLCLVEFSSSDRRGVESVLPLDGRKDRNSLGFLRILLEAPLRYLSIKLTFPDVNLELNLNVYERG